MKKQTIELMIATPEGLFRACYSDEGLSGLNFPEGRARRRCAGAPAPRKIRHWHRATASALKAVLAGREPKRLPPLATEGTEFRKSVWEQLRKLRRGETKSYGQIAAAIGRPAAVRAVGGACGANPIPVLVPCHRVVAANGKAGGFSGGMEWKRKLLAREGVRI
ncbi:MAG: methylated-DNA--[protein]-cysteine S-methyltransferase [Verrucomicrobia bacterium]|nr:methylated-DNA--[protein]-cysteine S-methyltransferase [Verrucomicrobiota bacterium]MDE3099817.1 methylated-DNA--[protein]-cysteine S-methyltransferase [Verrucomicrobiota bacterium]